MAALVRGRLRSTWLVAGHARLPCARLASTTAAAVPVIDINPFLKAESKSSGSLDEHAEEVLARVDAACQQHGFFTCVGHGFDPGVASRGWRAAAGLFDGTEEAGRARSLAAAQDGGAYGYQPYGGEGLARAMGEVEALPDLKESWSMGPNLDGLSGAESGAGDAEVFAYAENRMPGAVLPGFDAAMEAYWHESLRVAHLMLRLVAACLDLPSEHFEPLLERHMSALRINWYGADNASEWDPASRTLPTPQPGQLRAGAHSDYGLITLLLQRSQEPPTALSEAPSNGSDDGRPLGCAGVSTPTTSTERAVCSGGLQVQSPEGSWLDVPPMPGALVVNVGDMLQRWTNDRWRSAMHRVVDRGTLMVHGDEPVTMPGTAQRRMSVAFFVQPRHDARIECLPACLNSTDDIPRYPPILAGEHIMAKFRAANADE